ncbi:MAG: SSU ribosomal protein S18P alanine acetyltransferase, ribosomal-protein-alanine N-acetyltransferase [Deltaproteobacteria bacterium CSP1-8]|nr:MAG: SSU ribosomal protein S18P alanine acetyltransferase, ribosomal-protein-alanine N-acetyltransferase [Deltaproteobacteria bacterium CSP1-8]
MGIDPDPLVSGEQTLRFRIRDLAHEDLDGVMAIEKESFPSPWSRALFEEEIGRGFSDAIVAVDVPGGSVAGYAICWTVGYESHLLNIAVRPDARNQGVGRSLLKECIRRGVRAGGRTITLEVRAGNEPALSLYRRDGFRFTGVRRGYYTDTGEDAIVLLREIGEDDAV